MDTTEKGRREALLDRVKTHGDADVREVVQVMEERVAMLERQLAGRSLEWLRATSLATRMVFTFLVVFSLVAGTVWWKYGEEPASIRAGYKDGYAYARRGVAAQSAVETPARVLPESSAAPPPSGMKMKDGTVTVPAAR